MKRMKRLCILLLIAVLAVGVGIYGRQREIHSGRTSLSHPDVKDGRSPDQIQADFDAYMLQIFQSEVSSDTLTLNYMLLDPDTYGIADIQPTLGSYSMADFEEDILLDENRLASLEQYDYDALTEQQKLEYDTLHMVLAEDLKGADILEYMECLGPTTGIQAQLPLILSEYHFTDREDVEDYLVLLQQLPDYFDQIIQFETMKSEKGLFMGDVACQAVIDQCEDFIKVPEENYLLDTFVKGIEEMEGLSKKELSGYEEQNEAAVSEKVIPSYRKLADALSSLKGTGNNEGGVCKLPKGKQYYEYLIRTVAGSDRSMREIGKLIDTSLKTAQKNMSQVFTKSPDTLYDAEKVKYPCTDPAETVQYLKEHIGSDFEELPDDITCQVKYVDDSLEDSLSPALYLSSPIDSYKKNVVYLNQSDDYDLSDSFSTIAHESYPGHLYQHAYFLSTDPDPVRCVISIGGYEEGWGTYAERYGYELAGLDSNTETLLSENLIATLCLYAKADLEVNYNGWSLKRLVRYLKEYGFSADQGRIVYESVVAEPVSYMQYTLGYLEIQDLIGRARRALGDQFSIKEFHKFYLGTGPVPFAVLQDRLGDWIEEQKAA